MQNLINYLIALRQLNAFGGQRPWANHTKKGPGRKHQQGKPKTKEERNV